jgi:hypothetical protein
LLKSIESIENIGQRHIWSNSNSLFRTEEVYGFVILSVVFLLPNIIVLGFIIEKRERINARICECVLLILAKI